MHETHYHSDPVPVPAVSPGADAEGTSPGLFPGTEPIEDEGKAGLEPARAERKPSWAERRAARKAAAPTEASSLGTRRPLLPWDLRLKVAVVLSFVILVTVLIVNRSRGMAKTDETPPEMNIGSGNRGGDKPKPSDSKKVEPPSTNADVPPLPPDLNPPPSLDAKGKGALLAAAETTAPVGIESPPPPPAIADAVPSPGSAPSGMTNPAPEAGAPATEGQDPASPPELSPSTPPPPTDLGNEPPPTLDGREPGAPKVSPTSPADATTDPIPPAVASPTDEPPPKASGGEANPAAPAPVGEANKPKGTEAAPLTLPGDADAPPVAPAAPEMPKFSEVPPAAIERADDSTKSTSLNLTTPPPAQPEAAGGAFAIPNAGVKKPTDAADVATSTPTPTPAGANPGSSAPKSRTAPTADEAIEPMVHVVLRGENFWTISRYHYGSGRFYRALWHANRKQVKAPEDLYIGTEIRIPAVEDLNREYIDPPRTARGGEKPSAESRADESRKDPRATRVSNADDDRLVMLPVGDPSDDARRQVKPRPAAKPARSLEIPHRSHVVKKHETLRSIARDELGSADREDEIVKMNSSPGDEGDFRLTVGATIKIPDDERRR